MAFIKATGHCFTLDDIIYNFDYKKRLNITCKDSEELIGDRHISRLIKAIFRTCLELVLKDIVENNTVFWLPTNKIKSCIKMQAITGDDFKKARQKYKWLDVDITASNFTGYQLGFFMYGNRTPRKKNIYVSRELKDRITQKTNEEFNYGDSVNDKYVDDYILEIKAKYYKISKADIKKILCYFWRYVYLFNSYGGDVIISNNKNLWCYFGKLHYDSLAYFKYYIRKLATRLTVLYRRKKIKWNGYYYFALTNEQYEKIIKPAYRNQKWFTFNNITLYQILDVCKLLQYGCRYIYQVPLVTTVKHKIFMKEFKTKDAKLIIVREPPKFKDVLIADNKYDLI